MRLLMLCSALLSMITFTDPALAVTAQAGDIFTLENDALRHIDGSTGLVTVVSCTEITVCGTLIGSGPRIGSLGSPPEIGLDGGVYFFGELEPNTLRFGIFRIDTTSGDREFIEELDFADFNRFAGFTIYPAPSFFPPNVASLGTWGIALLVIGLFIGIQIQNRSKLAP